MTDTHVITVPFYVEAGSRALAFWKLHNALSRVLSDPILRALAADDDAAANAIALDDPRVIAARWDVPGEFVEAFLDAPLWSEKVPHLRRDAYNVAEVREDDPRCSACGRPFSEHDEVFGHCPDGD